jgi:hypothetical protein
MRESGIDSQVRGKQTMKTTYELGPARLKLAIEAYMASIGKPVTDADVFTVAADGSVTVVITEPDEAPVVAIPIVTKPVVESKPPIAFTQPPIAPTGEFKDLAEAIAHAASLPTKGPFVSPIPAISTTSPKGDFEKAFTFVIKWEGSEYEDVSGDPGGPTKYGIDSKDHPSVDIKGLTFENAKQIYLTDYWQASNCDNLPSPVAETHFNYAVNTGREQSIKFMQRALGLEGDGQFGPATADALAKADPRIIALGMVSMADAFYKSLAANKGMGKFLTGWLNRNNALRSFIG